MLRKYWFYSLTLLHVLFDLSLLVYNLYNLIHSLIQQRATSISTEEDYDGRAMDISFWFLSYINGIFLLTYGFLYTNAIFGTFLFQQTARFCLMALWIASTLRAVSGFRLGGPNMFFVIGGILHTVTWVSLWVLFIVARCSRDPLLRQWTVNIEDLASKARPLPHKITFRGIRRPSSRESRRERALQFPKVFMTDALFRRVHPVETKAYALCQHLFAVGAIALILTRVIIFLAQLDNEKLPSRALVAPCWDTVNWDSISVLVRHPNQRGLKTGVVPNTNNMTFQVAIAFRQDEYADVYNTTADQCVGQQIKTGQSEEDTVDWFWLYNCENTTLWFSGIRRDANDPDKHMGFEYTISTQGGSINSRAYDLPSIWLVQGILSPSLLTPYLAPPLIPTPNAHTVHSTHYSSRKFISSSPLRDAITGSKPGYNIISLYPASPVYSSPIASSTGSNTTFYSSGFIRWPKFLDSSSQTPRSDLAEGIPGPAELCEVVEEYRAGNAFDILASIGGLLALLQGIHIFLFGRPLFWGFFGAKLITPFGFVGRFATRGFRERLRNHYNIPEPMDASTAGGSGGQALNNIRMTQFLLDYVLDLGPASPFNRNVDQDPESCKKAQQDDINLSLISIPQGSSVTDLHAQDRLLLSERKTKGIP